MGEHKGNLEPRERIEGPQHWVPEGLGWRTINRWLWIALPQDCQQCVHLAFALTGHGANLRAVQQVFRYLMRELRREVWDHQLSLPTRLPRALQPARARRRTGFHHDIRRHRDVRLRMSREQRIAIAKSGQAARRRNGTT